MLSFETKCYENDWEFILKGNYLENMIARCNFAFSEKVVYINNVRDLKKVRHYAEKKLSKGTIDKYVVVEDHAEAALNFFNIPSESFKGGYYYSIAELVGIYLCRTKYLIHFSSDSFPDNSRSNWIQDAIDILDERPDVFVANPTWDFNFVQAKEESFDSVGKFYLGKGFSDQCYLIRTDDFRKQIYNEKNDLSERYPVYGGELFEKRVDSYMQNHRLLRITSKESCYVHRNFGKNKMERLRRKLDIWLRPGQYR